MFLSMSTADMASILLPLTFPGALRHHVEILDKATYVVVSSSRYRIFRIVCISSCINHSVSTPWVPGTSIND